jgi:predicted ArsR family transcriptional regulator
MAMAKMSRNSLDPIVAKDVLVRSHPVRTEIVAAIRECPEGEMAASQIARLTGTRLQEITQYMKRLEAGEVLVRTRRVASPVGPPMTLYKLADDYRDRAADSSTLDKLAAYLHDCNGTVDAERVREIVKATGRRVSEGESRPSAPATSEPDPAKAEFAEKLRRMQVLPLHHRCQCEGAATDSEGRCVSCSKLKVEAAVGGES